ncbi:DUF6477 family protein [Pseudooceanicola aestuarii]|uniref:DUF6477 family protein n=1 Tax=Pseudooceanicola aestuarii TaxID=2697319 RepID=UPI0013D4758D|nr:DUF6477 family protein [Pseudooceanicola aestuarii]
MQDVDTRVRTLRRPRLLVAAARIAAGQAARRFDQPEDCCAAPGSTAHLLRLLEDEAEHEARRRARDASYSAPGHVTALGAVIATHALRQAAPSLPDSLALVPPHSVGARVTRPGPA